MSQLHEICELSIPKFRIPTAKPNLNYSTYKTLKAITFCCSSTQPKKALNPATPSMLSYQIQKIGRLFNNILLVCYSRSEPLRTTARSIPARFPLFLGSEGRKQETIVNTQNYTVLSLQIFYVFPAAQQCESMSKQKIPRYRR